MVFRIFMGILILANLYMAYQVYSAAARVYALENVPPAYSIQTDTYTVTVVEFLDYSCRFCKEIHPIIAEAVERDGRVRYIPRPIPAEGGGTKPAELAYMAGRQGKFLAMHNALIKNFRALDDMVIDDLARQAGLDLERLHKDMNDEEVKAEIRALLDENAKLYNAYGGRHTPTFMIAGRIRYIPAGRMPTVNDFLALFREGRALLN